MAKNIDSERTLEVLNFLIDEPAPVRRKRKMNQDKAKRAVAPDATTAEVAPPLPVPENAQNPQNLPLKPM
jgi:hypothetical protein